MTELASPPARAWLRRVGLLALAAALYLPLAFLGYGSDDDSYRVVRAGRNLLARGLGDYASSRNPGYLVHEAATGVLDAAGGSLAANLGTVVMALVALACFGDVLRRLAVPHAGLALALVALHPLFWANTGTTMDYVWALGLVMAGWALGLRRRWAWAGLVLGLAVGARLSSFVPVGGVLLVAWWAERDVGRGVPVAGALAALVGLACYVPPAAEAGWTLGFLEPVTGGAEYWTPALRLGKFSYKNVYAWGLPAAMWLAVLAVVVARERGGLLRPDRRALAFGCGLVVLGIETLYLAFPMEQEYLLPALPFLAVLLALGLEARPRWLVALVALTAAYNVVSLNVARPDVPNGATGASVGLWVEEGYLVRDVRLRWRLRHCATVACWAAATGGPNRGMGEGG